MAAVPPYKEEHTNRKKITALVLSCLLVAALSACAGGSPDAGAESAPPASSAGTDAGGIDAAPAETQTPEETQAPTAEEGTQTAIPGDGEEPLETGSDGDYEFEVYETGTVITEYIGDPAAAEITVPGELGGKPVIGLGILSFSGTDVETVTLPSTLRTIGDNAFYASGLYEITIPAGVETVGEFAFNYNSNLSSVTIDGADTVIEQGAFNRNHGLVCHMPASTVCDETAFDSYSAEIIYTS